jgi:hypothetical protein
MIPRHSIAIASKPPPDLSAAFKHELRIFDNEDTQGYMITRQDAPG